MEEYTVSKPENDEDCENGCENCILDFIGQCGNFDYIIYLDEE